MSVRLLLAVVLAGALIAASLPAIDAAQQAHADAELTTAAEDLTAATQWLVRHSDPVPLGVPAATRRVTVTPPAEPDGARLLVGPPPDSSHANGSRLTVQIPGDPATHTRLGPTVRPMAGDGTVRWNGSLSIRDPTELTLTYRQVGGRPVVAITRGFK
jgi:hypothetical protein